MQPYKIDLYVYAESEEETKSLQDALKSFVIEKREQGIVVTASSLSYALNRFKNSSLILNFFRNVK